MRTIATLFPLLIAVPILAAEPGTAPKPFPGAKSAWNGFDRFDFKVLDRKVLVVTPAAAAPGRPWVWRGRFFGHRPEADIELLKRGFHVAYMDVPEMLGSPEAVRHWDAFHKVLTEDHGLSRTPALEGMSRGGLYVLNWAIAHPDRVSCIYADAPVCDFKSWPGGRGKGKGSPADWKLLLKAYGFKDDAEALAYKGNPVDNLGPLAEAKVPLLIVSGDADDIVPFPENGGLVKERYEKLGGPVQVILKPGVGHKHGLDDPSPIVEFIAKHAK
jgi:pimeloyl-ACP methyl ester carboxylesterase